MAVVIGSFKDEAESVRVIRIHKPLAEQSLTVSGGGTPTLTSAAIRVRDASRIVLTVDHNRTGSDSTDMDTEIYTSVDGATWDTEPYVSVNLGASKIKSMPVTSGMNYLRWKITNNDASNATKVLPVVTVMM